MFDLSIRSRYELKRCRQIGDAQRFSALRRLGILIRVPNTCTKAVSGLQSKFILSAQLLQNSCVCPE
jgi:hypothetical protein